jgi:endoglucanase
MKKLTISTLLIAVSLTLFSQNTAHEINAKLGRGINFGNMFESPRSGDGLGPAVHPYYFEEIADKGFSHIRMPIKWSDYALETAPYTVEPEFIDTIKAVVDMALEHELMIMINMHHYDEIFDDPAGHTERFLAIWDQISIAFKDYSDSLLFELLNEPHRNLDQDKWNALFPIALDTVRKDNPTRKVVIGPPDWNGIYAVDKLVWPESDTNLIMTVHYYNPFHFTHQGASWVEGADAWLGTTWDSTASELQAVIDDFAKAVNFFNTMDVPVHVGEFGSYSMAEKDSRRMWTAYIPRIIESFGFSWSYWEFKSGFGAYDDGLGFWKNDLLRGLTEQTDPRENYPEAWEIGNPDFSRGLAGWDNFWVNSGAVATLDVINEEAVIDITALAPNSWNIQFAQLGLELVQGAQYKFSFDARSEGAGEFNSTLGKNSDPYTGYSGSHHYVLTDVMTPYTYTFTMTYPTDPNTRCIFDMNFVVSKIFIDNCVLELLFMPTFVEEISLGPDPATIDTDEGTLQLTADVLPEDATDLSVTWIIISGEDIASISSGGLLKANGTADGTVKVSATAKDGSQVSEEISVEITNQTVGIATQSIKKFSSHVIDQRIEFTVPVSKQKRTIHLYSIDGRKVWSEELSPYSTSGIIIMDHLESNIYVLEMIIENEREIQKISYVR